MSEAAHLRVLVVDDEPPARRGLKALLAAHADLEVVGEASSGADAIAKIRALQPSLVFLDVQMPEGDGFSVIREIGAERMPATIFTTAFDAYALPAFEADAVDYLLKPYDRERFEQALARARRQLAGDALQQQLARLLERLDGGSRYLQRLSVRQGARTQLVPVANIELFEAEANYVRLWAGEKSVLLRETLSNLEQQLDPARFQRVHRSLIVQVARVIEAESLGSGEYVLRLASGRKITTGRSYREAVQQRLGL